MSESRKLDDTCSPLDECCLRLAQVRLSSEVGAAARIAAGGAQGVFTLEAETSRIVVANDAGCSMLGFNLGEMHLMRFSALFVRPDQWAKASTLCSPEHFADFAGKVVSLRGKGGNPVTVSLSLHPLPSPHKGTLAVITPALSDTATVTVDPEGCISQLDEGAEHLFRCAEGVLKGEPVCRIIPQLPSLSLGEEEEGGQSWRKKLRYVGNTEDDAATKFPLSIRVTRLENVDLETHCYQLAIQALPRLSGMMVVDGSKTIVFCSQQLVVNLFGYSRAELVGRPVTLVIPDFCANHRQDFTQLAVLWETEDQRSQSSPESLPYYHSHSEASWHVGEVDGDAEAATSDEDTPREFCTAESSMGWDRDRESSGHAGLSSLEPTEDFSLGADDLSGSSDEFISAERTLLPVRQGFFCGAGLHKDQTPIDIRYRVGQTKLCHSCVSLVWVEFGTYGEQASSSRASRSSRSSRASRTSRTSRASHSAASTQLSSLTDSTTDHTEDRVRSCSRLEGFTDAVLVAGGYGQLFVNTRHIGSGSFGVVKLARSKLDSHMVVSKFICKSKLDPTFVVDDSELGMAPMELVILRQLDHPGVVSVERVFQNDDFFILVMEHGQPTMDLFEFFSSVNADESLTCHIFQQVGRAVQYLDSKSIVHRDLKDENMIIDLGFKVKLVDFGSAAFFGPGMLFCTFFGTPPYCSPEVLLGNSYAGPELEVWSLGVVLFTISFGHFPFPDVASTVRGGLRFPDTCLDPEANPDLKPDPDQLRALLREMLHPSAEQRIRIGGVVQHAWCAHVCQLDNYSLPELLAKGARDRDAEVSSYESGGQSLSELRDLITSCESLSGSDSGGRFSPSSSATATATVGNLDTESGSESDRSLRDSPLLGSC